jgi:hypothetical protein
MRNIVMMLLLRVLIGMAAFIPAEGVAASPKFKDVKNNFWGKVENEYHSERGIINGYKDGTFGIIGTITRAEAASLVMRALGWGYGERFLRNVHSITR